MKKYEFTGVEIVDFGIVLKQIRRIKDGLIGGYIQSESNLTHDGNAWVEGNARVVGNAWVGGNAWVVGNARVGGNAQIRKQLDYLYVGGFKYNITILHNHTMSIGCQTKSFEEWENLTVDNCFDLNPTEYDQIKKLLTPMIEFMKQLHPVVTV